MDPEKKTPLAIRLDTKAAGGEFRPREETLKGAII